MLSCLSVRPLSCFYLAGGNLLIPVLYFEYAVNAVFTETPRWGCSRTAKWVLRALMSAEVRADDTDDTSPRSDLPPQVNGGQLVQGHAHSQGFAGIGNIWSA